MTYLQGRYLSEFLEHFLKSLLSKFFGEVLDVAIGEPLGFLTQFNLPLLPGDEAAHKDFLGIEQHPIDLLDGVHRGLFSLEMDEAVTLRLARRILHNLEKVENQWT